MFGSGHGVPPAPAGCVVASQADVQSPLAGSMVPRTGHTVPPRIPGIAPPKAGHIVPSLGRVHGAPQVGVHSPTEICQSNGEEFEEPISLGKKGPSESGSTRA